MITLQCRGAESYICLFGLQQPKLKKKERIFKEKIFIIPQKLSLYALLDRAMPFSYLSQVTICFGDSGQL